MTITRARRIREMGVQQDHRPNAHHGADAESGIVSPGMRIGPT
jgi:hypothetical protein